ncbi:unnamed protein product [Merluccius merluccius]
MTSGVMETIEDLCLEGVWDNKLVNENFLSLMFQLHATFFDVILHRVFPVINIQFIQALPSKHRWVFNSSLHDQLDIGVI